MIKQDVEIIISTATSRKSVNWKSETMLWSEFLERISQTERTSETFAEFLSMTKDEQTNRKDRGGYVGGQISGGRRKNQNILDRCLLTLDVDNAVGMRGWEDYKIQFGHAAAIYTTHKHSTGKPRYRLIVPLDRPVFADEYVAIGRYVAGALSVEQFDPTTFEPARLMFWPSTAKDGDFFFDYIDGPLLSADDVLARYNDWRDIGEWAYSEKHSEAVKREIKKQGSPLEKGGVIGAFCRSYNIHEAIETFLAEEYSACDAENRYTFIKGSTAAGLVIYEDMFAYSHHGTDPAGGKLCNAFDLIRLHKFGVKDDDAKAGTPPHKLPSFTAMMEFAAGDPNTRKKLVKERLAAARDDFSDHDDTDENDDWQSRLSADKRGILHSTIDNALLILENDSALKGRLGFNEFAHREVALDDLPWAKKTGRERYLVDSDDAAIRHFLEKNYGFSSTGKYADAMKILMLKNSYHPVKQYLEGLIWDGSTRLENLFIEYLGARDTEYTRVCTRTALVAAVARIFEPGVKFDHVLTLVGAQGLGKSTVVNKLGGEWYSDSLEQMHGRDAYEQLQGAWIIELGELSSLRKSELDMVKHFITKKVDRFRVAYGRRVEDFPRQCIFFGSTNKDDFLRDETGERRWWPIDCISGAEKREPSKKLNELTEDEVAQIWAEAVALYRQGHKLYLPQELEDVAREVQKAHAEADENVGLIEEYLNTPLPMKWYSMEPYEKRSFITGGEDADNREKLLADGTFLREKVCVQEIWCELYGGRIDMLDARRARELRMALSKVEGWEPYDLNKCKGRLKFGFYGLQKAYVRTSRDQKQ